MTEALAAAQTLRAAVRLFRRRPVPVPGPGPGCEAADAPRQAWWTKLAARASAQRGAQRHCLAWTLMFGTDHHSPLSLAPACEKQKAHHTPHSSLTLSSAPSFLCLLFLTSSVVPAGRCGCMCCAQKTDEVTGSASSLSRCSACTGGGREGQGGRARTRHHQRVVEPLQRLQGGRGEERGPGVAHARSVNRPPLRDGRSTLAARERRREAQGKAHLQQGQLQQLVHVRGREPTARRRRHRRL